MATTYTTNLELATPTTGELAGSWGDVVNDQITTLVEEAITGIATITGWATNAHTLSVGQGTSSESRCAILDLQDAAGLTAAGTLNAPDGRTKIYIVVNNTSYAVTVQTVSGTGVSVPSGETMWLYSDGTNILEATNTYLSAVTTASLTATTVDINGGTIDGTAIGATTPSTGAFTTVDIDGGTIDGTVIGGTTTAAGSFTTLQAGTSLNVDGTATMDGLTVEGEINLLSSGVDGQIVMGSAGRINYYGDKNDEAASSGHTFWVDGSKRTLQIDAGGDISFYDTAGTNVKFHWSAADERLGIGTSSPSALIDIYDPASTSSNDLLLVRDYLGGGSDKTRLVVKNGGDVGIGTDSPSAKLDVAAPTTTTPTAIFNLQDNVTSAFSITQGTNEYLAIDTTNGAEVITLGNTTTIADVIVPAGNVGIGTDSPAGLLDVVTSTTGGLKLEDSPTVEDGVILTAYQGSTNSNIRTLLLDTQNLVVRTGLPTGTTATERLRIDSSGNVGIDTDSPIAKLHVTDGGGAGLEVIPQTVNDRTTLLSYDRNASTYQTLDLDASDVHFNVAGTECMLLDSSGDLTMTGGGAIGWANYTFKEEGGFLYVYNGTTKIMRVDSSGNAAFAGDVEANATL